MTDSYGETMTKPTDADGNEESAQNVEIAAEDAAAFEPDPAAHSTSLVTTEESSTERPPNQDSQTRSVARNSGIMALGSIVSRATGFLRTAILGAALSGAVVANSYQVADTLPNMLYELLLGGVLTSVVVPLMVKARKDPDGGEAYVQRLMSLAVLLLAAATLLALLAAPLITQLIVSDGANGQEKHLVTNLSYLLLPEIFFYGMAAMMGAVLNTRGHFAAPMWSPIVNNVVVIGTAVVFMITPGPTLPTPATITASQLLVLGVGTTLGVCAQAISLWPALRKVGFRWRWRFDFRQARLGEVGRLAAWMLCYVAVSQIGVFVQVSLAYRAGGHHGSAGSFIYNDAYLLFMMAHGIVAVSVITALLPQMSAAAVEKRFDQVSSSLSLGIRLSSVLLVPATAAYLALGVPTAVMAFQWGRFTAAQAQDTGFALMVAGIGLVPFAIGQLQIFAFYALRDTKTPALLNIPTVLVRVGVDVLLYLVLPSQYVVIGLMVGNTASYLVSALFSSYLLRRKIGALGLNQIAQTITRLSLASVVAGLIGWGLSTGMQELFGTGKAGSLVALIVGGGALCAAFIAGSVFLRVSEVTQLWERFSQMLPFRTRSAH